MSLKASLSVLFGFQFGQAKKLLHSAEVGHSSIVEEILAHNLQLAAYAGFHGTTTPLHRAVEAGHFDTCRVILDLIKSKIKAVQLAVETGKEKESTLKRWKSFLSKILDQRTHQGLTPLMIACQRGHPDIVALLLADGADPLMVDIFHCRTALHFAATAGHADCVRILCSENTKIFHNGRHQSLRDVVTSDISVQSAKYIDLRAFGGLTALHFAAISGDVDTIQVLLSAGAATMPKTENEAFIKDEYLTPGSTPLHIAVITANVPIAHALLQAHADLMSAAGTGERDERHRRIWEGHSRTDIRSVRNVQRKLPYHLARERGLPQLVHLVDPRISIDSSLDTARDTEYGIGPKSLSSIASAVMQSMMMSWLDEYEKSKVLCDSNSDGDNGNSNNARAVERGEGVVTTTNNNTNNNTNNKSVVVVVMKSVDQHMKDDHSMTIPGSNKSNTASAVSRSSSASDGLNNAVAHMHDYSSSTSSSNGDTNNNDNDSDNNTTTTTHMDTNNNNTTNNNDNHDNTIIDDDTALVLNDATTPPLSPRRVHASASAFGSTMNSPIHTTNHITISGSYMNNTLADIGIIGSILSSIEAKRESNNNTNTNNTTLASLASLVRIRSAGSLRNLPSCLAGQDDGDGVVLSQATEHNTMNNTNNSNGRGDTTTNATTTNDTNTNAIINQQQPSLQKQMPRASSAGALPSLSSLHYHHHPSIITTTTIQQQSLPPAAVTFIHTPHNHNNATKKNTGNGSGGIFKSNKSSIMNDSCNSTMLCSASSLSSSISPDCSRPGDANHSINTDDDCNDANNNAGYAVSSSGRSSISVEDDGTATTSTTNTATTTIHTTHGIDYDRECGICLDDTIDVIFTSCHHGLCLGCARNLTKQEKKPPSCPFCRKMVVGFEAVV